MNKIAQFEQANRIKNQMKDIEEGIKERSLSEAVRLRK